ncbi:undecaprenyl-phosphate glucose phosphotransferase [Lachnospiraceae oral taxon 107 str. F0167]|uniref:undecaprenyl-phosphate glucose phosphotransferase n=1 Tax=Lachnoanaerobaculum sp. Marseille-Q4761 TaxID=2819511 RepID=UPI00020836E4|nr:undecaprenyl-phosphate glucose phosphotransferase [Lachnoanaerobaculum sp. Marseille-Q4761]EGG91338.1 undecaprenyl-phosphate glucose phosphotransferase [Lachnospiraceae oral taxon 107 str. F0167]MBO1869882.1 undecaprenyl-phosphate glucose phosphotransferase [Lachnoanaerobaculum sp. Marseille-Q4761]RKW36906.1 MAG: undecaprenyl-phosphate glucose phosphotransferase [Lachnospiraceae bacterium]
MIKENQKRLNRLHVLLDAVVIFVSYLIAYLIMYYNDGAQLALSTQEYFSALIIIIPGFLILYEFFELYTPKRVSGRRSEIANIFKANSIGFLIFTLTLYLGGKNMDMHHFSRRLVIIFYILTNVLMVFERSSIRIFLMNIRQKGYNQKHVLLIGYSRAAEGYIDRVKQNPEWGYNIRGILDDNKERGFSYNGIKVIGTIQNLHMILEMNVLDEIAITLSIKEYEHLEAIVNDCEKSGVHTKFIPDYNNFIPTIPHIEDLWGLPVINIRHVPLTELHNAYIKRIVDIFGALFGIILFSPVMIISAILVKLTDGGPIIYAQERVGLHNKPFRMYKFRSMAVQKPSEEKSKWTTPNDPRVTGVGRFIRKTSIDEMPQFFNILKGDMSLVGPRPERPFYVEKFREEIPHYMIKHQVRPGLTGWAQVNGFRGDTSIQKRIDHDLYYIENWTLGFDFKIMFLTIFKGFINKNAY